MKKKLAILLLVATTMMTASADTIGSLVINSAGATINGTNLLDSTEITPVLPETGLSFDDLAVIPPNTAITGGVVNLGSLSTFTIAFGAFGSFSATSGQIVDQNANFLDVFYVGSFTGDGVLAGNSGPASVRLSMNQTGASAVSFGGTLAAPPENLGNIPEPSTYALIGVGLVGLAVVRRKLQ